MKRYLTALLCALCLAVGLAGVNASGQSGTTIAAEVDAAHGVAGDTWLTIESELCGPAQGGPGRSALVQVGGGQQRGPPPREQWYRDPVRVFDNMYLFPTNDVNAWAIQTSAGIILIDATYDYTVRDLIADSMKKVGLDPAQIKFIVLTHGHADHAAGVKYLQDTYGARVLQSAADWDLLLQPPGGAKPAAWLPKKDMVATDGQKLTLGDTTITLYLTPGHTMGVISPVISVKNKGTPHAAAFWGGTAVSVTNPYDNIVAYAASARRFQDIAARAGVDVVLSNHERYYDQNKRLGAMRANPAGPNPFIVGPAKARDFLRVIDHCAQALALAAKAKAAPAK